MPVLPKSLGRRIGLFAVGVFFSAMGVLHFASPEGFARSVPPYLPAPLALVYISGVFEILGGIGVFVPSTRRIAGYGLLALLAAVYPANIHMALNLQLFPEMSPLALYTRLPFQFVFAALVWWATRPDPTEPSQQGSEAARPVASYE